MERLDRLAAAILAPLAVWVLASGLDDLFLDLAYLILRFSVRSRNHETRAAHGIVSPQNRSAEPLIALLVPCWHEADVIERMLDTNLTAIEYSNYEVWLGVYPNDPDTIACVLAAERRFPRIRHAVCPNNGPTTKADCLNAVYRALERREAATGQRYEIILQHDAEDMIHPQSLLALADACRRFDMVQAPVFPLRTPARPGEVGRPPDEAIS